MVKKAILGQISDTDIRLLRVYKAVVDCGGFSAAELELNINRSTISRHIKDLEIRLGVSLCRRGRSGFSLTPEGRHIYEAALRMLASLDAFRTEVNDAHSHLTGTLCLGFFDKTVTNPEAAIGTALQLFDDQAPDVSIEIYVETINEIERGVMEGRFQIGIIPGHRSSTSLDYFPLFDEQMYLYCGEQHPLYNIEDCDIEKQQVLSYKYAGIGYHSPNMEVSRQLDLKRSATAFDQEAIAQLILSGRYLGYLPEHYAQSFVDQCSIRPLCSDTFQYHCHFHAISRHAPKPGRVAATFIDALLLAHGRSL